MIIQTGPDISRTLVRPQAASGPPASDTEAEATSSGIVSVAPTNAWAHPDIVSVSRAVVLGEDDEVIGAQG
jgi:hypothetical protein